MPRRTAALVLVLATLALLGAAAWASYARVEAATEGTVRVPVQVVGPSGERVFDATVPVENATAYDALLAAAAAGGFDVRTQRYAMGLYVYEIAGFRAHGSEGWIYSVERDGGTIVGDRASNRFALREGDRLAWSWTDAPLLPGA